MLTRRDFLVGSAGVAAFRDDTLRLVRGIGNGGFDPTDDRVWAELRDSFFMDPELTVFNNVGLAPPPKVTVEAQIREERRAASDPAYHIWRKQEKELDPVRRDLASLLEVPEGELALTMNASYGLQTGIMGFPMDRGDEILTTSFEYPRVLTAMRQRERRDGVKAVVVPLESPPLSQDEIVRRVMAAVTPKTKLVVLSQITYLIGQILPISRLVALLRPMGVHVLCDGAQAIGLMPETAGSMGTTMYTACLHKWIMGPIGTGVFAVKGTHLAQVWPLHPADADLDEMSIKFEQVGTHPVAPYLAIPYSLELHHRIGLKAKAERLEILRKRIAAGVLGLPGVKHWGSLDPDVCRVMLTVSLAKVDSRSLAGWLLSKHKIHVTTAVAGGIDGIRISPNIFTTQAEIDRLVAALSTAARDGI